MRKAISIFFILLANMILLAHGVIPHHYHNGFFAAIVNIFDDDAQMYFARAHCSESHCHDTHSQDCALDESVFAASSQKGKCSDDGGTQNFGYHIDIFAAEMVATVIPAPICSDLPFISHYYIAGCHIDYIAHSIGLRAPPTC